MRKNTLDRNKCKVNEPQAKLEHRRFYDYVVEALKWETRSFYDHFVRKANLEKTKLMNEKSIQTLIIVSKTFQPLFGLVRE